MVPCLLRLADCSWGPRGYACQSAHGRLRRADGGKPRAQGRDSLTPDGSAGWRQHAPHSQGNPFPLRSQQTAMPMDKADKRLFLPASLCAAPPKPAAGARGAGDAGASVKGIAHAPSDEPPVCHRIRGRDRTGRHHAAALACASRRARMAPDRREPGLKPGSPTAPGPTPGFPLGGIC